MGSLNWRQVSERNIYKISNCYNTGNITENAISASDIKIGGIVGYNRTNPVVYAIYDVNNCYDIGKIETNAGATIYRNPDCYYIDSIEEAERVLVDKLMQTTVTVAKDVKFQVEFNPSVVAEYRLLGYENRTMSANDFEDDTKDVGEVGAGQQVTVLY